MCKLFDIQLINVDEESSSSSKLLCCYYMQLSKIFLIKALAFAFAFVSICPG